MRCLQCDKLYFQGVCQQCHDKFEVLLRCQRCGLLQLKPQPHNCEETPAVYKRTWSLFRKTTEADKVLATRHQSSLLLSYWISSCWKFRCKLDCSYEYAPCRGKYFDLNALVADILAYYSKQAFSYQLKSKNQIWIDMEVNRKCLIQLNQNSKCILWAFTAWLADDE